MLQIPTSEITLAFITFTGLKNHITKTNSINLDLRQALLLFSTLCHNRDVDNGLALIRKDIDRGKINDIIPFYDNDFGD